ncbi:hypothetical protein DPMN_131830 [Dreissena polymorpha]|uniref:Uncharacterized protein n=1 Tax=Dreissena polymorpha TaxID=45954 RepID=A0A9D4FSP0_DREPO|nr:hypothetical protein DPMN_131830 [Dreissena polymorpha]
MHTLMDRYINNGLTNGRMIVFYFVRPNLHQRDDSLSITDMRNSEYVEKQSN